MRQATFGGGSAALCRDCGDRTAQAGARRCPRCGSPRLLAHPELDALSIAHVDCDAFYASVEKRDAPEHADRPVIIGGGRRGVVSTACYIARLSGVRSAMPMFKALERCPSAVVIKPDMAKYVAVSRQIRDRMEALTPLVEPLSLDEAFLDLTGTERLHRMSPAEALAALARDIEREVGVSVSIGLAPNKFLAKIASDLDKPRGFSVIGRAEMLSFLAEQPVEAIWGVGKALAGALRRDGLETIGDLRALDGADAIRRYGAIGARLVRLAHGDDSRPVTPNAEAKSVSSETTFDRDVADPAEIDGHLWRMSEKVSARMKAKGLEGRVATLKLKRSDFKIITRRTTLTAPTQLADDLYRAVSPLAAALCVGGVAWRLAGVGLSGLSAAEPSGDAPEATDLLDASAPQRRRAERAVDSLRARFGADIVRKGRSLR